MRTIKRFSFPIIAVLFIAAAVPFFIMRNANRATHAAAVLLDVTFTASVTPNRIGRGQTAWAELDSEPTSAYSWRIKAGNEFASIDAKNGRVTSHRRPDLGPGAGGTVTVEAYFDSSSAAIASTSMLIDDEGCSSCSGSRTGAGDIHIALASGDVTFDVGRADEGKPAGVIWLKAAEPSTDLATTEALTYTAAPEGVSVIKSSGDLRQLAGPDGLIDLVTIDSYSFEIRFYSPNDQGTFNSGSGLWEPDGDPFVVYELENPNGSSNFETLVIRKVIDSTTEVVWTFIGDEGTSNWTLLTEDGSANDLRNEEVEWSSNVRQYTMLDGSTERYRRHDTVTQFTFEDGAFEDTVDAITQSVVDPNGDAWTTKRGFYATGSGTGKVGKVKFETYGADGSWLWLNYDSAGRISQVLMPWKDQALSGDPPSAPDAEDSHAIAYSYTPVDEDDEGDTHVASPRTITESVLDETTAKAFYVFLDSGTRVIEQRCPDVSTAYANSANLHTETAYQDARLEKPTSIIYPDSRMDVYTYEPGVWDYDNVDPVESSFTVDSGGTAERVTIEHNTDAFPTGIEFESTHDVIVSDNRGNQVYQAVHLYDDDANPRLAWTVRAFDARNRPLDEYRGSGDDDHHSESHTTWDCCNAGSITDTTGVETTFVHDELGRMTSRTKEGMASGGGYAAQADLSAEYTYDAANRQLSTTTTGGTLSLETSRTYDLSGRVLTSTAETGLETEYDHDLTAQGGRKVTVTHPGDFTEIMEYYREGQIKSRTGTAIIAEYYDYGVNEDGTRWSKTSIGGSSSPRYATATADGVGRTIEQERPAYSSGTVTSTYVYADDGRLEQTSTPGQADMLYEYDDFGNVTRSGLDLNDNGQLDASGTDRITQTEREYDEVSDEWWHVTTQKVYATNNSSTTTTASVLERKLTGLSASEVSRVETTDIHGNVTIQSTAIDRSNKLVTNTTNPPDSDTDAVTIARNGLPQSSRSATNLTSTFAYDDLARRTEVTDARGNTTTTSYNSLGQVEWVENEHGDRTTYTYSSTTGRLDSVADDAGKDTRYSYNSRGQTTRIWGDAPQPVEYEYDSTYSERTGMSTFRDTGVDWTQTTWPGSPGTADETAWEYHEATGLLTEKTYADETSVTYTYTADGKLDVRTWARTVSSNPLTTDYGYDAGTGEMTSINYSDSTPDVTFTYNRLGQQATVVDAAGTRTFAYNSALQPATEKAEKTAMWGLAQHDRRIVSA